MSYAAPFSLLSWHVPDHDESVAERLRWPLAGSALLHAVVFVALLGLRFGSSLEQSSGSYEVRLVTLPEIAASPTAAPQRKAVIPPSKPVRTTGSRSPVQARVPERAMDALVSVPKPQPTAIPKVVTPPVSTDPRPILKQNVDRLPPPPLEDVREVPKPERVTESLVSALDSVVVPKPQTLPLPQESAPVRPSAPAPVEQTPAAETDVPAFKAPPEPPKLVVGKSKTSRPTPTTVPSVDLLAPKLKQAVGATSVPKKPEQVSKRVSPAAAPERKQKPDAPKAPESSAITLPSRAPRLAAVVPPEMRKKETPLQTGRKSSTVESLPPIPPVPEFKKPQPAETPSRAVPLVSERVPPAKAAEARNQSFPKTVFPSAPPLAEFRDQVPSEPTVPKAASEPDTPRSQEIDPSIPDLLTFDPQPVSEQTEGGTQEMADLLLARSCSNADWKETVEKKIDRIHKKIYRYLHRVKSPAILAFRVKRNGQVTGLTVARSSGDERFDLTAKHAVLESVPLPPFPANMTKSFCQVQHTFRDQRNPQ